jgi:hypothetical protein
MEIPEMPMEVYEEVMNKTLGKLKKKAWHMYFRDMEDLRKYREDKLLNNKLSGRFSVIRKVPTKNWSQFIGLGFKIVVLR